MPRAGSHRTVAPGPRPMPRTSCPPVVHLAGENVGRRWTAARRREIVESRVRGTRLLAEVGRAWEDATAPARDAGIRVVHLRIGIVLNPAGGALAKMLLPFQLGVGGRLGSGRQWMSWISREDLVGAIHHALQTPSLQGPVNAVAPAPVTNAEFTRTLARVLRRPALAPVPAVALRALFGEMAQGTVLASQRVRPTVLEASGFRFAHPTLAQALRFELGRG